MSCNTAKELAAIVTCLLLHNYVYAATYLLVFVTGFWKTDHIVMREINIISMSMLM